MPRDGSGNYTLPSNNPVEALTTIQADWANETMAEIAVALTDSLSRSGQGGMLAALPFVNGTLNAPGITFTDETTSGLYKPSAGVIAVSITSTDVARFSADKQIEVFRDGTWTPVSAQTSFTGSVLLPVGNDAQRDAAPTGGMLRFNTDSSVVEFFDGTVWLALNSVAASLTAKQKFDAAPTASADLGADYYASLTKQVGLNGTEEGADMNQLKDILAAATPPAPTTSNPLNFKLEMVGENTLTARIIYTPGGTGGQYERYFFTKDSEYVPVLETEGTAGLLPSNLILSGYVLPELVRLWLWIDGAWARGEPHPDGAAGETLQGYLIQAIDSIAPVVTLALTPGSDPITEVDYTITISDDQSGVDLTRLALWDAVSQTVLLQAPIALTGTLTTLPPLTSLTLFAKGFDFQGAAGQSPDTSITTDAAGGGGSVEFNTDIIEVAEDAVSVVVPVSLSGRTDLLDKTVKLIKREWTTTDTGQVEPLSTAAPVDGVLVFNTDEEDETQSITVTLTDTTDPENRMFELYFDPQGYQSEGAGALPIPGVRDAMLIRLLGTGATGNTDVYQVNSNNRIVIEMDAPEFTLVDSPIGDSNWEKVLRSSLSGGLETLADGPDNVYHLEDLENYVNINSYLDSTAQLKIKVNIPADGNYFFWFLIGSTAINKSFYVAIDGDETPTAKSAGYVWLKHDINTWDFRPLIRRSTDELVPLAVFLSAGEREISICPREGNKPMYIARMHVSNDVAYNPSSTFPGSGTPVLPSLDNTDPLSTVPAGVATEHIENPLVALGPITVSKKTASFAPLNAATGVSTTETLTISIPGGSGLIFNEFGVSVMSGVSSVSGGWSDNGSDTITFDTATWAEGEVITVTGVDVGSVITNGVRESIEDFTWSFTIANTVAVGGYPMFANVPVLAGEMAFSWFDAAKAEYFTEEADELFDFTNHPGILRTVSANSSGEATAALLDALPGDRILLGGGTYTTFAINVTVAGTEENPIIICGRQIALGSGGPTIIDSTAHFAISLRAPAKHIVIGGIEFKNQPETAIKTEAGAYDGTTYSDGATDIRVTQCSFERVGKVRGTAVECIKVHTRAHRFRVDHCSFYHLYGVAVRFFYAFNQTSNPTTGGRVDHNFFGEWAPDGHVGGVTYEAKSVYSCCVFPDDSDPDLDILFESNVVDTRYTVGTSNNIEFKSNGAIVQDNIIYGTDTTAKIALRQGHNSIVRRNYLVGVGVKALGAYQVVEDNYVDGNYTLKNGIETERWGFRTGQPIGSPETKNGRIHYNTVKNCTTAAINIGRLNAADEGLPVHDTAIRYNFAACTQGECIKFDTSSQGGGSNLRTVFFGNYYSPTGTGGTGTAYALDTPPPNINYVGRRNIKRSLGTLATGTVLNMDLSSFAVGYVMTAADINGMFPGASLAADNPGLLAGVVKVVLDPYGSGAKVLKIQFREGESGIGKSSNPSGIQWKTLFASADKMHLLYEIAFSRNWKSPKGMHLPRMRSDGITQVDPGYWSSTTQLYGNNRSIIPVNGNRFCDDAVALYYYDVNVDQLQYYANRFDPANVGASASQPHIGQEAYSMSGYSMYEDMVIMNDVGSANGTMQTWLDGELAINKANREWRSALDPSGITRAMAVFWTGGPSNNLEWAQVRDQALYIRRFILSANPIGHDHIEEFLHTPLPAGAMNYAWFAAAKAQFLVSHEDDPVDWQTIPSLRDVVVTNETELQAAVDAALPGDRIMVAAGTYTGVNIDVDTVSGDATLPIIICAEDRAKGLGGETVFDGLWASNTAVFTFSNGACNYVMGGFEIKNTGGPAIALVEGGLCHNNRFTDMLFTRCCKIRGEAEGVFAREGLNNNTRFDHNVLEDNYAACRYRSALRDDPPTYGRIDHNYFGNGAVDDYDGGATYEIRAIHVLTSEKPGIADTNQGIVIEGNYTEIGDVPAGKNDDEIYEIKSNGVTVRNNIIFDDQLQGRISLRQGHNSVVESNYLVGMSIFVIGAYHTVVDNVLDGNATNRRGVGIYRWGSNGGSNNNPETHDNLINYNTMSNFIDDGITVGEYGGSVDLFQTYDNTISNNHASCSQGDCIDFDTTTVGDGANIGNTFTNNWYAPTGTGVNGDGYDEESPVGGASVEASTGSRTLTTV